MVAPIAATGDDHVANNDVNLAVYDLPQNQFGYFLIQPPTPPTVSPSIFSDVAKLARGAVWSSCTLRAPDESNRGRAPREAPNPFVGVVLEEE